MPLNRGNIQNLELMLQDQPLRDVGQRLEPFVIGVTVRIQNFGITGPR